MARRPVLSIEKLKDLGAEKLAQLVLDETERNAGFRRQIKAALAGQSGPNAIAKVIDRRLSGLERAKSFVELDRARTFRDDLRSLIDTVMSELGPAAPALAIDRLLRFIATEELVFERVDDSSGHIQDVYYQAISGVGELTARLGGAEAQLLPEKIMARLGEGEYGYLVDVTNAVVPHLPMETLSLWDAELSGAIAERQAEEVKQASDLRFHSMTSRWSEMRQTIATARGDIDLFVALEAGKHTYMQDTLGTAGRLLEAGRAAEALEWVRKPGKASLGRTNADMAPQRVSLEARILGALGNEALAKSRLWTCFEETLSADALRVFLKLLPEFEDIEAEERAYELALKHANTDAALRFFLAWPRLDLAAELIVAHRSHWDGRVWHFLSEVAGLVEHDHPLAATILYRALLDDILKGARSKAYSHAARYLHRLELLSEETDEPLPDGMANHQTYLAELRSNHPRKVGFWRTVDDDGGVH